jgi:hypothetical protein
MQKEFTRKEQSKSGVREEEWNFTRKGDAIAFIEKVLKAENKEPYSFSIGIPNGETLKMFGYKKISSIKAPEFIVHVRHNESEFSFEWNFGMDICKKCGKYAFDKETLQKALKEPYGFEGLSVPKFEAVAIVFTALNKQKIKPTQFRHMGLRTDRSSLDVAARDYREQLNAANLLLKSQSEGLQPKDAVHKVLVTTKTDNVKAACVEYEFEEQHAIVSDLGRSEKAVLSKLQSFINRWMNEEPKERDVKGDLYKIIEVVGADAGKELCKLHVEREIIEHDADISDWRERIDRDEQRLNSTVEELQEQFKNLIERNKAELNIAIRQRPNLGKTLEILSR